jgi:protein-S-isoprenylcysteine O-methyltransferase Ste14
MPDSATTALSLLALGWLAYAALHSFLASLTFKAWVTRRWPACASWYRLAYNLLAVVLVLPLLWATWAIPGDWLWRWTGLGVWFANGLALAALSGFWLSSGSYDMGEFLGLKPLREKRRDAAEHDGFRISPLHRYVRHPWYALGLVLIWTRDMNAPLLVSALAITLYFVIGSWLEERKLEAHFGAAYREYRQRVPGLIPLPWKRLTAAEADELLERSMQGAGHRQHEL